MSTRVKEKKSTYKKPAVIHRELLEGFAGACEKQDPINGKMGGPPYFCAILYS